MSIDDRDDPFAPTGSLSTEGKLEGLSPTLDDRRAPEPPRFAPAEHPPLELDTRGYQPPKPPEAAPDGDEPQPVSVQFQQRQWLAIAAALIVILGAGVAFLGLKAPPSAAPQGQPEAPAASAPPGEPRPSDPAQVAPPAGAAPAVPETADFAGSAAAFTVQSEPPGATVFIGDEELGTTPYLGTNDFPRDQPVTVRVALKGYATWTGVMTGSRNARLTARLKRR
jgi:hypothetical protein